jgi:DNA processing protein
VPGPIDSPTSVGPHRLIQQGAKLVQDVEDIFQEFPGLARGPGPLFGVPSGVSETGGPAAAGAAKPEDPLLALLGSDPLSLEELLRATGLPASQVLSRLTVLELEGLIRELPGKRYVLEN